MRFHTSGQIRYLTMDLFSRAGAVHGIFSRQGGVSPEPWKSLNMGGLVGDSQSRVVENRKRAFTTLGRKVESIYDSWLIHGTTAVKVTEPRPLEQPHVKADIILTDRPEITLFMRYADCVPILLYDPIRKVAGLAHAGWVGTVKRVASVAVDRMKEWYGCSPKNILAGIGPSICMEHYPVGKDVSNQVEIAFPDKYRMILYQGTEKNHFDLWRANQLILEEAGVEQIEITGVCTACHIEDWYSHRAENGKTGRFGAIMALGQE